MSSYRVEYPSWDTDHEHGYVIDSDGYEWLHSAAYRGAYQQRADGIYVWSGGEWWKQTFGGDDNEAE